MATAGHEAAAILRGTRSTQHSPDGRSHTRGTAPAERGAPAGRLVGRDGRRRHFHDRSYSVPYTEVGLAVFRGRDDEAAAAIRTATRDAMARGEGMALTYLQWATAVLHNGACRYDQALESARQAVTDSSVQRIRNWALPELIEAAVRTGHQDLADEALRELYRTTEPCSSHWAAGLEAHCRALLAVGTDAEDLYRTALGQLECTGLRAAVARVHLLYGEWLRRERRNLDARDQLRQAHEMFVRFGMDGFAERARSELSAAA